MSSSVTPKKAQEPAYDPPPRAELERFQAVLQTLLPKQPRLSSPTMEPISAEREQSTLVEMDAAHTNGALAERHPVLPVILPTAPAALPEQSPVPRFQRTTADSQRRAMWWIFFASVVGVVVWGLITPGLNRGNVWERLVLELVAMLTFGAAYLVWGRPRVVRPPDSQPEDLGNLLPEDPGNLPAFRWPPSPAVFPLQESAAAPVQPLVLWQRILVLGAFALLLALLAFLFWPGLGGLRFLLGIVVHDLGQWWAVRRVGARNTAVRTTYLPLGAMIDQNPHATQTERMFVTLLGPAPVLLLGCLIYALDTWVPVPVGRQLAFGLVSVGLGYLLPIVAMDGGRIVWAVFARHSPLVQAALSVGTFLFFGVAWFNAVEGQCFLWLLVLGVLMYGRSTYQDATAALAFRRLYPQAVGTWQDLSERQLWNLYVLVNQQSRETVAGTASQMRRVFDRAREIPRETAPVWSLVAWGALWLLAAVTAVKTELGPDLREARAAMQRQIEAQSAPADPPEAPDAH